MSTIATDATLNTLSPAHNDASHIGTYTNKVYAFNATGGFTMEQGFDAIKLRDSSAVVQYDVTDALQVTFDVATFNAKLGITKKANATGLKNAALDCALGSYFDVVSDNLLTDSITLTAAEFVSGMSASQVVSVGNYDTLYSDFVAYVKTYFGYDGGFSSLFNAASEFDINGGVFDANAFMGLISGQAADGLGAYIKDLSGAITISNISNLLRNVVDANIFGNRTPSTASTATGTAVDPANNTCYGVADGFIANDLIWVPAGTTVTLKLDIDIESFAPLNNIGSSNGHDTAMSQSTTFVYGTGFTENTTASNTNITRVLTAPLLIRLVDF
jgi:hypothetical protein